MKKTFYIFLFFLIKNLSFGQTQVDLNQKADYDYKKTDKELNVVYQKILAEYKTDAEFIKNLKILKNFGFNFAMQK